jgi:uncharacterized membrane protein
MDTRALGERFGHLVPLGLALVLGLLAFAPVVRASPLRIVLALPLVLFAPGYAVVTALAPTARAHSSDPHVRTGGRSEDRLGTTERVVVSVLTTLVLVTLVGVGLNALGLGLSLASMLAVLGTVTLVAGAVAVVRSAPSQPGTGSARRDDWLAAERPRLGGSTDAEDGPGLVVVALVVVALAFALASVGVAATADGEAPATGFFVATESANGSAVLADYPGTLERGDTESLVVGINNHGESSADYTVVVALQRVEFLEDAPVVVAERELARYTPRVAGGETWRRSHTVTPELTGERLRLTYLLYRGEAPNDPSAASAYRKAYLWVDATEGDEASG